MKLSNIGIVIQARMNSSRLPGKILRPFCGKPMLIFQVELLKQFNLDMDIVVLTSDNPLDDEVEKLCREQNILCYRGSEENVFERFKLAAKHFRFDHMVRLTGDNPLTHNSILRRCVQEHLKILPDLTSTRKILDDRTVERFVPKGFSVDVINCKSLVAIESSLLDDFQKEHVIPVFFENNFQVNYVTNFSKTGESMSIDTEDDFDRVNNFTLKRINNGELLSVLGLNCTSVNYIG